MRKWDNDKCTIYLEAIEWNIYGVRIEPSNPSSMIDFSIEILADDSDSYSMIEELNRKLPPVQPRSKMNFPLNGINGFLGNAEIFKKHQELFHSYQFWTMYDNIEKIESINDTVFIKYHKRIGEDEYEYTEEEIPYGEYLKDCLRNEFRDILSNIQKYIRSSRFTSFDKNRYLFDIVVLCDYYQQYFAKNKATDKYVFLSDFYWKIADLILKKHKKHIQVYNLSEVELITKMLESRTEGSFNPEEMNHSNPFYHKFLGPKITKLFRIKIDGDYWLNQTDENLALFEQLFQEEELIKLNELNIKVFNTAPAYKTYLMFHALKDSGLIPNLEFNLIDTYSLFLGKKGKKALSGNSISNAKNNPKRKIETAERLEVIIKDIRKIQSSSLDSFVKPTSSIKE